jgi:hypothetical protein
MLFYWGIVPGFGVGLECGPYCDAVRRRNLYTYFKIGVAIFLKFKRVIVDL